MCSQIRLQEILLKPLSALITQVTTGRRPLRSIFRFRISSHGSNLIFHPPFIFIDCIIRPPSAMASSKARISNRDDFFKSVQYSFQMHIIPELPDHVGVFHLLVRSNIHTIVNDGFKDHRGSFSHFFSQLLLIPWLYQYATSVRLPGHAYYLAYPV